MITKTKAYTSSDGAVHASLEAAQRAELVNVFTVIVDGKLVPDTVWTRDEIVDEIIGHADRVRDILTTRERSRPAARAVNGGTRKPTAKPPAVPHNRVGDAYTKMRAEVDKSADKVVSAHD